MGLVSRNGGNTRNISHFFGAALYREGMESGRLRAASLTHQEAADAKHSRAQAFAGNYAKFQYFLKIGELLREGNFCSQKFPSLHAAAGKNVRGSSWKKFQRWMPVKARSRTWAKWLQQAQVRWHQAPLLRQGIGHQHLWAEPKNWIFFRTTSSMAASPGRNSFWRL